MCSSRVKKCKGFTEPSFRRSRLKTSKRLLIASRWNQASMKVFQSMLARSSIWKSELHSHAFRHARCKRHLVVVGETLKFLLLTDPVKHQHSASVLTKLKRLKNLYPSHFGRLNWPYNRKIRKSTSSGLEAKSTINRLSKPFMSEWVMFQRRRSLIWKSKEPQKSGLLV